MLDFWQAIVDTNSVLVFDDGRARISLGGSNVMRRREFETSFGQMAEEMSFRVDDEVPEAIR
jgi:hypothetical protein